MTPILRLAYVELGFVGGLLVALLVVWTIVP